MSVFYPKVRHCKKWILVADKEIPESLADKLGLYRIETGRYLYSFDSDDTSLRDAYISVASACEEFGFDAPVLVFEPRQSKVVY